MENTNDRRANYKDSVKKRLTELEIGLRIQDKQIVKNYKMKKAKAKRRD